MNRITQGLVLILLLLGTLPMIAQEEAGQTIEVTGTVTDVNNAPIKNAMVFVDSVKTKAKTNKKGIYKVKLDPNAKVLTVYSPKMGVLSMEYTGQKKVSFMFTHENKPISKKALSDLGFSLYSKPKEDTSWYKDYSSILEILDKRFYNVRVTNGVVKIGKGPNHFHGESEPMVLVNDQPMDISVLGTIATTDVQRIEVIDDGSEAATYGGLRAANGVIIITLKQ